MKRLQSKKMQVAPFSYNADPGRNIFLAGTFNEWDAHEHKLDDLGNGEYSISLKLNPGTYEYKFIVDNEWCLDQCNDVTTCNECGYVNNLLILN
jgi:5'-AMP-activated protein kinase regulatory beta subunit